MNVFNLHRWDVSYQDALSLQRNLKSNLIIDDQVAPSIMKTIAGSDVSYSKHSNLVFASVVVLDFTTMEVLEEISVVSHVSFPYIPGLLSFREGPALVQAFEKLHTIPDVVMIDGHGISHPRGIGIASHLGLWIDLPSIGCAKKKLVGTYGTLGHEKGSVTDLLFDGSLVGSVVRTKNNVKPVFVSPGHKIGVKTAVHVVLSCSRGYRIPEPVRKAHLAVNRFRSTFTGH